MRPNRKNSEISRLNVVLSMLWKKNYEKKRNPANDRIAVAFLGEWKFCKL